MQSKLGPPIMILTTPNVAIMARGYMPFILQGSNQAIHCCWETTIGQELYKLTFTHLLADWANIALLDGGRWALSRLTCQCCSRWNNFYNKWVCLETIIHLSDPAYNSLKRMVIHIL